MKKKIQIPTKAVEQWNTVCFTSISQAQYHNSLNHAKQVISTVKNRSNKTWEWNKW